MNERPDENRVFASVSPKQSTGISIVAINLAGILGCTNIIANSPDLDRTLFVFLIPIWLQTVGACIAGVGHWLELEASKKEQQINLALHCAARAISKVSAREHPDDDLLIADMLRIAIVQISNRNHGFDTLADGIEVCTTELRKAERCSQKLTLVRTCCLAFAILLFLSSIGALTYYSLNGVRFA